MLSSKELYDKIEELRIKKGLSVNKLSQWAGISHGTLRSWKERGTYPTLEVLEGLCFALEASLPAILYDIEVDKLTGDEVEVLSLWKQLNDEQKKAIITTMKSMCIN